ncbi:hypothetical protein GCM10011579_065610 [Streptomyces albiflavescens]|uniref:Uncharacterized protein n=1 Tax=Streptomyces albiflavescens TaxID=1623582 RepID=A0A917Y9C3_9ACTN|nr:hypothetical protein GCM10011579_065610 [Streptomyces albiflavescens]
MRGPWAARERAASRDGWPAVFSGQTLPAGSFFEVALDVGALTGIAPSCPGSSAASLYLRSITGSGHNGNLKGYLQPITIQPNTTCSVRR